ncbi:hypothetical protein [Acinetobacter sp. TUM15064]|uniref:hypothetical protein n=1 Tax=Acinetobacter sp. TUM15064 TaxID=2609134 RepID=UPI00124BE84B|nr:hypothetical protein [Acinetobacter sp. TUM15064]
MRKTLLCFITTLYTLPISMQAFSSTLEWEVNNRFPLFSDSQFLNVKNKLSPYTTEIPPQEMIEALRSSMNNLSDTAWDKTTRSYKQDQLFKDQHVVNVTSPILFGSCNWRVETESTHANFTTNCQNGLSFKAQSNQKYLVKLLNSHGKVNAEATVQVIPKLVVALGDSFASGEGNPDQPTVFNKWTKKKSLQHDWILDPNSEWPPREAIQKSAEWLDAPCHRSLYAWPTIAALYEAINNKHSVIQFASFACSGAEAYDGLITQQKSLVGLLGTFKQSSSQHKKLSESEVNNTSQQFALAKLLCNKQTINEFNTPFIKKVEKGFNKDQNYFGAVEIASCQSPRHVDQVLLVLGGNDVGFSGVVKWVMKPNPLTYKYIGKSLNPGFLKYLYMVDPKKPEMQEALNRIPMLYEHVNVGFNKLNIDPKNVNLMLYPDLSPIKTGSSPQTLKRELEYCQHRSREANRIFQKSVYYKLKGIFPILKNDNANFGFIPNSLNTLGPTFIEPLRNKQIIAASGIGWNTFDSQESFYNSGICSGSLECVTGFCTTGNRIRWYSSEIDPQHLPLYSGPAIEDITKYDAYDPLRQRGIRYGYDALLTGLRLDKNQNLQFDWITNTAHPTANVHAKIGQYVFNQQKLNK